MGEMDEMEAFMAKFAPDVDVIWGCGVDNTLGDQVKITILAAGFDATVGKEKVKFPKPDKKPKDSDLGGNDDSVRRRMEEEYGADKVAEQERQRALAHYIVLEDGQFDNDDLINFIEKNPTFRRGNDIKLREEWERLTEVPKEISVALNTQQTSRNVIEF